jgi:uncharacterized lipoprotein YddW (UPF0748 family)
MLHSVDLMSSIDTTGTRRSVQRIVTCALIAAALLLTPPSLRADDRADAIRAVRIIAAGLESIDAWRRLVASATDGGFNTIFVPIALDSAARSSQHVVIEAILREARERGLRVHASVLVNLATVTGELPASRDHVVYRHPEWLMVPREIATEMLEIDPRSPDYIGRIARWTRANPDRADGLYVSPLHADAADYIAHELKEIVTTYAVDGVHLEGVRFPGRDFDYSRSAMEVFGNSVRRTLADSERVRFDQIEAIDPFGYAEELPEEWRRFRATRLTSLVTRLRTTVRAVRPDAIVSAGIITGAERAFADYLQDWRTWLDNQFVDALANSEGPGTALLSSYDTLLDGASAAASH